MEVHLPSKGAIGQIAENQPMLLNLLVAYFVFEWRSVRNSCPPHGVDQTGQARIVPDYIADWTDNSRDGIDVAVHLLLLRCPGKRASGDPGLISEWVKSAQV